MMLRRYHNVEQVVQAVEKPPVTPADVTERVEEKPKPKRRAKKDDV